MTSQHQTSNSHDLAPGPLFVVSMWRAGSSLLYALLNQHPAVGLMYEADLPLLNPVFRKPAKWRDWPRRWEFWNSGFSRHEMLPDENIREVSLPAAFASTLRAYAVAQGATIWGDKSPNYYDRMTWLAQVYPNARFIVVWRNPMDTARSMLRAAASGSRYFQKRGMRIRALLGYRVLRAQFQQLRRRGVPVLAVDYENLVRDTPAVMRGVCRFLQIPFDERMLGLENANRRATYDAPHHLLLRGNAIVAHGERPEVVDIRWRQKIDRYLRLWQHHDPGWPAFPRNNRVGVNEPAMIERLWDETSYQFWRGLDQITEIVYSFAPLKLLRWYRKRRQPGGAPWGELGASETRS